jgi:hypothetical protein
MQEPGKTRASQRTTCAVSIKLMIGKTRRSSAGRSKGGAPTRPDDAFSETPGAGYRRSFPVLYLEPAYRAARHLFGARHFVNLIMAGGVELSADLG